MASIPSLRNVVGGQVIKSLDAVGVTTVEELLTYYPRRYVEHGQLTDLGRLKVGAQVTILARIAEAKSRPLKRRPGDRRTRTIEELVVSDGTGRLLLTFFNQKWRIDKGEFGIGRLGLFVGTIGMFKGERQLLQPEARMVDETSAQSEVEWFADRPMPIYPTAKNVRTWTIADSMRLALPLADALDDPLDVALAARADVVDRGTALRWIHHPRDWGEITRARQRLRWDEAFGVQVVLAQRRAAAGAAPATPRPGRDGGVRDTFDARLPFLLTSGQREVGEVLDAELAREHPMHRLLQGEVGSGKTVVALRAMLRVVDSGGQAALLAPTEVLAAQHARSIRALLGPLAEAGMLGGELEGTRVVLLTGSTGAAARREVLTEIAAGTAGIVVGTHALLEERVQFADLGMVVVDEQHRFGVEQRAALAAKTGSTRPHTLVMTATPIPRTVAMTVFGDLDVSTLRELPAGRSPITTHVVPAVERPDYLARAWQRAREEVAAGRQVYVVCPRIDAGTPESDVDELVDEPVPAADEDGLFVEQAPAAPPPSAAVETVLPALTEGALSGLRLAGLTGRMAAAEKDDVMARFADPSRPDGVDVLVATTVIEVGVDVPNATLMIVLDADRFGVSQLHQLRGRVGRGAHAAVCLLVTNAPPGTPARERLAAVAATTDGFELSRYDLASRREGDVLGAAQSGARRSLRFLSVLEHEDVIRRAREEATRLVADDPELVAHPGLAAWVAAEFDEEHAEYLEKT